MVVLVIVIICVLDIIARTYITDSGIQYEMPNGERKQLFRRKRGNANGKDEK